MTAATPVLPVDAGATSTRRATLLGFVTDAATEAALRDGLSDFVPEVEIAIAGLGHASAALRKLPSPEILVIDISGEPEPLERLRELAEAVAPTTRVLAVGDRADMNFYRALTRELGVAEYLYKPLVPEIVARLFGAVVQFRQSETLHGGRLLTVTGAGGGVGATTIAANLAWYLGQELRRHTLLFDPDLHTGAAALLLGDGAGTDTGAGLRIAYEMPERVDALFVQRTARDLSDRLALLAGEVALADPLGVAEGAVDALLAALRRRYNFAVIDTPAAPLPLYRDLLARAHQRVVVLDPTLASARHALRLLALPQGEHQARRAVLVLNRTGQPGALPRPKIEEALDLAVDVVVPHVPRLTGQSATFGKPAAAARGGFRAGIEALARHVAFTGGESKPRRALFGRRRK